MGLFDPWWTPVEFTECMPNLIELPDEGKIQFQASSNFSIACDKMKKRVIKFI